MELKSKLVLVSESPQRVRLLSTLGQEFATVSPIGDEVYHHHLSKAEQIESIAFQKALSVYNYFPNDILIAADTVIVLDDMILGKPEDETDAFNMLRKLSDRTHQVITGVCIMNEFHTEIFNVTTEVTFNELSDDEIHHYLSTQEPMGRSGSYAIQGGASLFVKQIKGDLNSVVGLPISEVYARLKLSYTK